MSSVSKSLTRSPSSSHMEHESASKAISGKQGIVAILGPSDCERRKVASLRRTLSADMSSKKWLAHHGFSSPMKKIASSEELSFSAGIQDNSSSSSSEEDDHCRERKATKFHIWSSIEEAEDKNHKMTKADGEKKQPGQLDIWTSIICQKANQEAEKFGPYIHPLVKKQSSLNKKSLEVCTESLGSESGSEGFSSYPSSETGDVEFPEKDPQDEEAEIQQAQQGGGVGKKAHDVAQTLDGEEFRVVKYNSAASKKLPPTRSFPPPLPSLSGCDGASVRMRTHRDNGRLVLKAVSVPSPNNFRAQRQDGRLVLTFVAPFQTSCEEEALIDEEENAREEEFEENFLNFEENESEKSDDDDDEEDDGSDEVEIKEMEIVKEEAPKVPTSRVTNVHRLALMMNRPIGFANRNPGWASKFNEVVKYGGDDEEEVDVVAEATTLAKSLPPRPACSVARLIPKATTTTAAASAASFNAYEYYWRTKPKTTSSQSLKTNGFMNPTNNYQVVNYEQQQLLLLKGNKGDHFAPFSKGCKEPRRSLLFWEPYCIATS